MATAKQTVAPSKALRVLHVIPSIGAARGGPSVVVRSMARSQALRGMDVHVATTDDNGTERIPADLGRPLVEDGVTYWIFRRQTAFYTVSVPLARWLSRNVAGYDVVHIHALFSYPSIAAAWCARRKGVPYIVRPLGTLSRWGMQNRRPWLKKLSFRWIESRVLRGAAGVHYTSEMEAAEAEQLGIEVRRIVIPNPVDLRQTSQRPGWLRDRFPILGSKAILLFLSRLDPKKGLDLLLPAFAAVHQSLPETALVVAGDGEPGFVERMKRLSRELGIEAAVVWTGFLAGEQKRAALADAVLFVLPSYSENFGVAVVEAMSAGLPVVVSREVGIHRQIEDAEAGLVVDCSVGTLKAALLHALGDRDLLHRMGANAVELSRGFDANRVAAQLSDAYNSVGSGISTKP